MKYVKTKEVNAVMWNGEIKDVKNLIKEYVNTPYSLDVNDNQELTINTPNYTHKCIPIGTFIVIDEDYNVYPCKQEIFNRLYKPKIEENVKYAISSIWFGSGNSVKFRDDEISIYDVCDRLNFRFVFDSAEWDVVCLHPKFINIESIKLLNDTLNVLKYFNSKEDR